MVFKRANEGLVGLLGGGMGEKPCGVMEGGGSFSIVLYGDPTFMLFINALFLPPF